LRTDRARAGNQQAARLRRGRKASHDLHDRAIKKILTEQDLSICHGFRVKEMLECGLVWKLVRRHKFDCLTLLSYRDSRQLSTAPVQAQRPSIARFREMCKRPIKG